MESNKTSKLELKILFLEDSPIDAELVKEQLLSEGFSAHFKTVSTESEFIEELKCNDYDLILSDYNLPTFNGMAALMFAKQHRPTIPFICVSGSIGEDLAVEIMKQGATDYVLKDRLNKLSIAVRRAIKESH